MKVSNRKRSFRGSVLTLQTGHACAEQTLNLTHTMIHRGYVWIVWLRLERHYLRDESIEGLLGRG